MVTERYSVAFLGFTVEQYSDEEIADVWEASADKVFMETGIDVNGEISTSYFVGQRTKNGDRLEFLIKSIRNPIRSRDKMEYQKAYNSVSQDVRHLLGNPPMRMTIEEIQTFYFEKD
jgi:hypothetical protein